MFAWQSKTIDMGAYNEKPKAGLMSGEEFNGSDGPGLSAREARSTRVATGK